MKNALVERKSWGSFMKSGMNHESFRIIRNVFEENFFAKEKRVSFKGFENLPGCVERYLRSVMREGDALIADTQIRQIGVFKMKEKGRWYSFEAGQSVTTDPPSFTWDARIRMAPFVSIKVRDAYSAGSGFMQGKIFGFIPTISAQGTPEMNAAALQRYLAEAAWYPTALLPSVNLSWTELDNRRAVATLRDSKLEVSLEFDFTRNGEIDGVFSPGRYYYAGGKYELVPWGGYFRNYQEVDHVRIPMEAEVNWIYPERSFTYLRCTIPQIRFNQNVLKCEACCG